MVRWTDRPAMTIAVDLGRKATKQTNKTKSDPSLLVYTEEGGDKADLNLRYVHMLICTLTPFKHLLD